MADEIPREAQGCIIFTLYRVPLMAVHLHVMGLSRGVSPNGFLAIIPHTSLLIILNLAVLPLALTGKSWVTTRLLPALVLLSALIMPLLTQTRSGLLLAICLGVVL